MKKLLFATLALALLSTAACKKEGDDNDPVPRVVGTWQVEPRLIDPTTGAIWTGWTVPAFELEINAGETGFRRDILGEMPFEWDLFNGDQSIVITGSRVVLGETIRTVDVFDIVAQGDDSAEWVISNWSYQLTDTLTGTTGNYLQHWFLQK